MSKIKINHIQGFAMSGPRVGKTSSCRIGHRPDCNFDKPDGIDEEEEEIYTGEWIDKTDGDHSILWFLKRKSKDTYVFLKDYKPKITEIITRLGRLEFQFGYLRKNKRKEDKEWRRSISEREKLLTERIEKLEEQMLNVLNPPLKPELKNPFD